MTDPERRRRADPEDDEADFASALQRARTGLGPAVFPGLSFRSEAFALVDVTRLCGRRERIGASPGAVKVPPHQSWQVTIHERDPQAQARAVKALAGQPLDGLILEYPLSAASLNALWELRPKALWINVEGLPEAAVRGLAGRFPGLDRLAFAGPAPACALETKGESPRFLELTHAYDGDHLAALESWQGLRGLRLDRGHSTLGLRPCDLADRLDVGGLEELGFSSGQGLEGLEVFSSLRDLRLSVPRFSPTDLAPMPIGLRSLELVKHQGLTLGDCRAIGERSQLRSLRLRDQRDLGFEEAELLWRLPELQMLDLSMTYERWPPSSTGLKNRALRGFVVRGALDVRGHDGVSERGIQSPADLRRLDARDTSFGLGSLEDFAGLEELELGADRFVLSAETIKSLAGFPRLRRLSLDLRDFPPEALGVLSSCARLRSLSLRLPPEPAAHLRVLIEAAPRLEQLAIIRRGALSAEDLAPLAGLEELFQLRLPESEAAPELDLPGLRVSSHGAMSARDLSLQPTEKLS